MSNMKISYLFLLFSFCSIISFGQKRIKQGYPIDPIPFTSVSINDSFWLPRLKASKEVTIPLAFNKCEETGRYDNFVMAANPSPDNEVKGYSFDDTDVYKTIEGASYILQTYPDKKLKKYIDSVLVLVAAAQEDDGYLYTSRTMNPEHPHEWAGKKRWEKVEDLSHEFYNLGHMIEGAIAHYQATNERTFLDIAIKYADCVCREIGDKEGQVVKVPGHQIAEMALAKLYVLTRDKKYLEQAKFFIDKRGLTTIKTEYSQSHKPVLEQDEAVGHAVRAGYMYSGVADVAALTGNKEYIDAILKIWNNVVSKKIYITGGIGSTSSGEAFGKNYQLPNSSAYCETCAAISNVYWNYRLFLMTGESKYFDVLERTLYNGLISGVSMDGGKFFYPNPLSSMGQHQRKPWFGCACCPSNICRFIPSLPGYIYAQEGNDLYVNLFISGVLNVKIGGNNVSLKQTTNYPWNENVVIEYQGKRKTDFNLKIRIPGWLRDEVLPSDLYNYVDDKELSYEVKVNGVVVNGTLQNGYFNIDRKWKRGDKVEIKFGMEPRIVKANNKVKNDIGRVAIERGPIVYCAEWPDNDYDINSIYFPIKTNLHVDYDENLLGGVNIISANVQSLKSSEDGSLSIENKKLRMIPYYAWAHRGAGPMNVWLASDLVAITPTKPATIASESKVISTHQSRAIISLNDRLAPSDDENSIPHFNFWPKKGTTEEIIYEFKQEENISSSSVYWFDDEPWGECRVPNSWKIYYKQGDNDWKEVEAVSDYPNEKNKTNKVKFKSVKANAAKLVIYQKEHFSSGLYEWEIN